MTRYQVEITPRAQGEFRDIRTWYRRELGPAAAAKVQRTILQAIGRLRVNPPLGEVREDLPAGCYRAVARTHLIIFRLSGDRILVLRIVHGARDVAALLRDDLA